MHDIFVGKEGIPHVRQPEGTELCFAAVTAAVVGEDVDTVHAALQAGGISLADGATPPLFDAHKVTTITYGKTVVYEAVEGFNTRSSTTTEVIGNIDERLRFGLPVALLYKKETGPSDSMHWVLIPGYDSKGIEVMDPLDVGNKSVDPLEVVDMIARSLAAMGVFAYTVELAV